MLNYVCMYVCMYVCVYIYIYGFNLPCFIYSPLYLKLFQFFGEILNNFVLHLP
jgi:hypothetical protein